MKVSKDASATRVGKARHGGPQVYIAEIRDEAFFKKPRTISEIKTELGNRGHHFPVEQLSTPLQRLCKKKLLRRQKASGKGFSYSNW